MKQLSNAELKMVIGGKITPCSATAECYGGGTKSCSGYSVGSGGGCDATDAGYGNSNGEVSCTQFAVDDNGYPYFVVNTYYC